MDVDKANVTGAVLGMAGALVGGAKGEASEGLVPEAPLVSEPLGCLVPEAPLVSAPLPPTSGTPSVSQVSALQQPGGGQLVFPEGTLSLTDTGWPTGPFAMEAGVASPKGTIVAPRSQSAYLADRALANRTNALTRRTEGYAGMDVQINEKVPVVLGGSPTDPGNKMLVTQGEHDLFNDWLRPLNVQLGQQGWRR